GGWPVFYEVGSDNLYVYIDLGMTLVKLGEEARVDLETFTLEGKSRKDFRYAMNKLSKEGCTFELVEPQAIPALLPELREVSDAWIADKHTREKGFSLGSFREDYLVRFPAGLVRRDGRIVAFANIWTSGNREELSVDLMRYSRQAPSGVMDYLFLQIMEWGKETGYHWFNLGMAPLSGLGDKSLAPVWNRIGGFVFQYAEHFYNFQGLRLYKEKFSPQWRPRYLASPTTLSLPIVLTNITALTSRGFKGIVSR
ncbi:MAG: GNAT family N-acetyltransferase, partial [Deltaproteobacteria bacterium]|nr:GNAT family N-acetyltransferase [Deltaproteobacteria bacterium]